MLDLRTAEELGFERGLGQVAGLDGSDRIVVHVKMVRAELLSVKGDLEPALEPGLLNCVVCGIPAHYVGGLGVRVGHWAHAEAAPHDTRKLVR